MKTKNVTEKNMKVCLVGSSGGHLTHLYMLKPFWKDKNHFWVTFDKEDARSLLEGEKMYPCYYPTNRSIKALIKNTKIAWKVLHKEKPDLIISCGAAVAVPFFYIGKMMGAKLVYIEVFDRIDKPTMTGKMVYPIVDKFVVQWEEQKKVYPKAVNLGSIEAKSVREAKPRLERIETDILNNFKVLGVKAYPLNGVERLQIMYETFHQEEQQKFDFSYDRILQSGMTTKDFIAPTSFLFKSGKDFMMGDTYGAASYLNILAPELTDKVLAEFLDMDKNLVVSIHVQSVDQLKAIKLIKGKITDLDRMKIEEQKKAVRSGYDMEIIPSDLATYGGEAKKILDDLQSRNERMPNCLRTSSTRYFTVGLTRRIECHRFFMATAENHCNVFCVTNWSSE